MAVDGHRRVPAARDVHLTDGSRSPPTGPGPHARRTPSPLLWLAIADGADWAEIDVQRTADDALVITHDTDLARSGGGN